MRYPADYRFTFADVQRASEIIRAKPFLADGPEPEDQLNAEELEFCCLMDVVHDMWRESGHPRVYPTYAEVLAKQAKEEAEQNASDTK